MKIVRLVGTFCSAKYRPACFLTLYKYANLNANVQGAASYSCVRVSLSRSRTSMPASVSWQPKESTSRVCLQRVSWILHFCFYWNERGRPEPRPGQAYLRNKCPLCCGKNEKEWQLDTLKHWYSKLLCQNTLCRCQTVHIKARSLNRG